MLAYLIKKFSPYFNGNTRTTVGVLAGVLGFFSNLLLFFSKLFIGSISGSVSIMADAINNLSDTASSIVTLVGFKIASKPVDEEHPYGHERFEYISGFIVSILISYVGIRFLDSSLTKILAPNRLSLSPIVYIVLLLSILMKLWQSRMYSSLGKTIRSNTLLATAQDSLNDVYTTIAILISAGIEWVTGWRLDGYLGALIAGYILYTGIRMLKGFIDELVGQRAPEEEITAVRQRLDNYPNIIGYHDLLIHSYGPNNIFASVHIEVNEEWTLPHAHSVIDTIERDIKENLGMDLVCHLDPYPINDPEFLRIAPLLKNVLKKIDPLLRMHDLRIDASTTPETVHFDLVVPKKVKLSDRELQEQIIQVYLQEGTPAKLTITFDRSYLL